MSKVQNEWEKSKENVQSVENLRQVHIWDKVFKNGPSKICRRQPLKNLRGFGLLIDKVFKNGPSKICGRQPLKN